MRHLLLLSKIKDGWTKHHLKRLAVLTFALFCCSQTALAYDFSAVCSTGQTLYYTVTSGYGDYCVYVTYPNTNADPWGGYTKPTGNLEIPPYVVNGIISYTVKFIGTDAFRGCTGLTSVSTPSSTYQIGSGAFSGCTGLTSVGISEGVEYIISDAFSNCPHLTTVNINSSALVSSSYSYNTSTNDYDNLKKIFGNQVTSYIIGPYVHYIGENAFRGCSGMTSVVFPNTLTSIDANAFRDCSNLVTADMPDVLLSIGTSAFHGCSRLSSVYISEDLTSIGWNAFFGCSSLTSVTIPNSVTNIGTAAFDNCFSLVQVTINNNAITSATYYSSSNLKKFFGNQVVRYILGSDVNSIGDYAFYGCTGLSELILPSSLTSIGSDAFGNCNNLSWVKISDMEAWCAIDFSNAYANPLYYAHHLYLNNQEVTHLTIPSSVSNIKDYAFIGLVNLLLVTIPNSVTSIGNGAFNNCTHLTTVTINSNAIASATYTSSNNLKTIFGTQVTSYTFGENVTTLGSYALSGCTNMTSVKFLGSVSTIRLGAFSGCSGLTRVSISNLAAWCGIDFASASTNPLYYAHFLYNTSGSEITSLVIPSTVYYIGKHAFTGCSGLTSVTMPSSVISIGNGAFTNCNGLNRVNISFLTDWCSINFGDGMSNPLAKAHHLYLNNSEVTELTIPGNVTTIRSFAFKDCTGLTKLNIHDAVTSIGTSAFTGCTNLAEIHVDATIPPTLASSYTFYNVPKTIPVYVPIGCVPTYQDALYWSSFTNYVGAASPGDLMATVPYVQEFFQSYMPNNWTSYDGQLNWNSSLGKYTANLSTNNSHWHFGYENGVFLSTHAWANIGNANHKFWLVSPIMHIDNGYNMLSFKMALTKTSGYLSPVSPGAQNNTRIFVLISTDYGVTWTKLQAWKHGASGYTDLEALVPGGTTLGYDLGSYHDQDIMVGFYMECTNANDAANRVHIDNFSVGAYDPAAAPTITHVGTDGHSATVCWEYAYPWQQGMDVYYDVSGSSLPNPYDSPSFCTLEWLNNTGRFFHVAGNLHEYTITGLDASTIYRVWVRYRDTNLGTESNWTQATYFETTTLCTPPKNAQVVTTQNSAIITWEPGQANQTSWSIVVEGFEMGEDLDEPYFAMEDLLPGSDFHAQIYGYCTDGDGQSAPLLVEFSTDDYDYLTVNDGTSWSEQVVVIGEECGVTPNNMGHSRSQFIIPAEMLTEMQYSSINKMSFYIYSPNYNGPNNRPWGDNAYFLVSLKEVDFYDFYEEGYCNDQFYDWDEMSQFYNGALFIENNKMTIEASSGRDFHYLGGNLLVSIMQDWESQGQSCQVSWYGVGTPDISSAMYEPLDFDPQCVSFLPKVTFAYEVDHYNPPTNFVALPQNCNEVNFGWMPCEGATSYEIEVSSSSDFGDPDDQLLSNLTGNDFTWIDYNLLYENSTFFARIRALYSMYGTVYGSSWSDTIEFVTPAYCAPPTDLTATMIGNPGVELDWTENGDATEWVIAFKADDETNEQGFAVYEHPFVLEAPYIEPNKTYTVRVRPICDEGVFVWSNTVTFSTNNIYFADTNVKNLCVQNWDTNSDGELSYDEAAAVTSLGYVFRSKTNIRSFDELQYFTGLQTIGNYAFSWCTNLTSVTFPNTLREIKGMAFQWCVKLTPLVFNEGIEIIESQAFEHCSSLTSVTIPASVTTIGSTAFMGSAALASITVDMGNTVYDSRDNCDAIIMTNYNRLVLGCKNTVIPTSVTAIGGSAFRGLAVLNYIELPNTIVSLGQYAFFDCTGLTAITLPPSVASIDTKVFHNCTGLTSITVERDIPPTIETGANDSFDGVPKDIPVYVYCDPMSDYLDYNGTTWGGFTNFIGIDCQQQSQVVALNEGWNWWAPIGHMWLADVGDIYDKGLIINSQDDGFVRYEEDLWRGTLTEFIPGKMYKIQANEGCAIAVTGTPVTPVTVTIEPGFNWIGYTGANGLTIAGALGSFTPAVGDEIHDEDGLRMSSFDGENWDGNLTTLQRGKGYLYYSVAEGTKTIVFE